MNLLAGFRWAFRHILIALGPIFIVVALVAAATTYGFLHRSKPVNALVVSNEGRVDEDGNLNYYPHFEYTISDGRSYSITSDTGTNPPSFKAGQTVTVLYDPVEPGKARIDSFIQLWFAPLALGSIGLVFICIHVAIRFFAKRRLRLAHQTP